MSFFYNKFENESLNKAYDLLENITPLEFDCGKLCGGVCCRGDEKDGMLLFPGEEKLFADKEGFKVYYEERYSSPAVVCSGNCSRTDRPLSCRIFPYMFYLTEKDGKKHITVAPDIRAGEMCDILKCNMTVQPHFLRNMRMAARMIESDEVLSEYVGRITETLTDFGKL